MPTIEISEKDHKLLMELSKELQTQENDSQAFPYFWGPRSTKAGIGTEDDTKIIYDSTMAETYTLEEFAECNEEVFAGYLSSEDLDSDTKYSEIDEDEWIEYVVDTCPDTNIVYSREEQKSEHNFSIFKSDVRNHIETNRHHLGKDPHTYARTFFRMRKMEELVRIVYRLNPQRKEDVNEEARRYVL